MSLTAQVAIVGCGPVGALLGNLLGRRGISCLIVEKQPSQYPLPRAVHFDGESMRVFQAAGLAEEILPDVLVGKGMRFQDGSGKVLVDWPRAQDIGPLGWHESYRFHQPDLEAVLRRGLAQFSDCVLMSGCAVTALSQNADDVLLSLDDGRTVAADYVVGCDGAQSFVRNALNVEFDDLGFKQDWLVVDLLINGAAADRGDYTIQFCDADQPATYVRGPGRRRRWELRLEDGAAPETEAKAWEMLQRWVSPEDAEMERFAVYTFRSAIAKDWRVGRCFLAGDAAHLTPPFMGQGMCAGVRDVANLAWKLAGVLGGGRAGVLDSYQSERFANVQEFIALAVDLGRLISQTTAGVAAKGKMKSIWPALGAGLGARDGLGGTLAPQVRAADGRLSDEVADGGFYVLAQARFDAAVPVVVAAEGWLSDRGVFGVVVRPDGYVFGGAEDQAGLLDLAAECRRLLK